MEHIRAGMNNNVVVIWSTYTLLILPPAVDAKAVPNRRALLVFPDTIVNTMLLFSGSYACEEHRVQGTGRIRET